MSELTLLNLPAPPQLAIPDPFANVPEPRSAPEQRDGSLENPAIPLNWPVELEMDGLFGPTSDAGVRVSPLIASQQAIVHACVRVRAESVGSLPLLVYETVKVNGVAGVEVAEDHPVHYLLHVRPNPFMSAAVFREAMQMCLDIHGNAYAVIERDNSGRPINIWPRNPEKITPCIKVNAGNEPDEMYFMDQTGTKSNPSSIEYWSSDQMLHIAGLGFDGIKGLSPIKYYMKNAIGLAIAADQFGSRFFANNGRPGGLLVYKGTKLDPKTKEDIKNSWQEAQAGKNTGRPAVLTGDWDWKQMQITSEEMQFLATRKMQAEQICGMYRVPPHMVAILERSTNNNIEHQSLEFVKYCLQPQINKWQMELTYKLLQPPSAGRNAGRKYQAKFDTSELVMGDFQTTMAALSVGLLNGTYSVNEARKKLNLNSIGPAGDEHTVQSQLTTLDALMALAGVTKAQSKQDIKDIKDGKTAAPDPNQEAGDQPDENLGDGSRYSNLFTDSFNRVCAREKRDSEAISKAFEPLLLTIANDLAGYAQREFKASTLPIEIVSKVVTDQVAAMAKRADEWKAGSSADDLTKACRSLRIAIFKEVAVQKAKGN